MTNRNFLILQKKYSPYLKSILRTIINKKPFILTNSNKDDLHDFRVALRKILSINSLLHSSIGYSFSKDTLSILKKIFKATSKKRDLDELWFFIKEDVYSTELENDINSSIALQTDKIRELVENSGFVGLLLNEFKALRSFMAVGKFDLKYLQKQSVKAVLLDIQTVIGDYANIDFNTNIDFELLHGFRKSCKRCRYQLDFILLKTNCGSLICKNVQEKLGVVNDFRIWLDILENYTQYESVRFATVKIEKTLQIALAEFEAIADEVFSDTSYEYISRCLMEELD